MSKKIALPCGRFTLVNDEDFSWLNKRKWCTQKRKYTCYVVSNGRLPDNKRITVLMHRLILGAPQDMEIDHINGEGLDNRRGNLRLCTKAQNQHNGRRVSGSSKYKGVHWANTVRRWRAKIAIKGEQAHLGDFSIEKDAALAYDKAAVKYYAEFACTNKMLGLLE